ncbi:MAG: VOC family protein [Actinomycetota bacterium]
MIHWVTAFIDVPDDAFDRSAAFWTSMTETTLSELRGDRDQFVTLEPGTGVASLRMQKLGPAARLHLDFHTDDKPALRDRAIALGAELVAEPGHVVMRSPGGLTFCLVAGDGTEQLGAPIAAPAPHRVDQLCVDIPSADFEAEISFWTELTGWRSGKTQLPEFRSLEQPPRIPYRFLFQRLGEDDPRRHVDVHLDISCGEGRPAVTSAHADAGAEVLEEHDHWAIMRDPAGLVYCLTDRRPWEAAATA